MPIDLLLIEEKKISYKIPSLIPSLFFSQLLPSTILFSYGEVVYLRNTYTKYLINNWHRTQCLTCQKYNRCNCLPQLIDLALSRSILLLQKEYNQPPNTISVTPPLIPPSSLQYNQTHRTLLSKSTTIFPFKVLTTHNLHTKHVYPRSDRSNTLIPEQTYRWTRKQ